MKRYRVFSNVSWKSHLVSSENMDEAINEAMKLYGYDFCSCQPVNDAKSLIIGQKYRATWDKPGKVKLISIDAIFEDFSAVVTVEYRGRLFFMSAEQLYI